MHGDLRQSQGKGTQVSCVARMNANSQILAILLLRFGALPEKETRKRKRNENNPKRVVTIRAASPKSQTEVPSRLCESEDSVPVNNIDSVTKLVNWPRKSIGAEESAFGSVQSWDWGLILALDREFPSWYEESSRLDHLDLGEVPTPTHPRGDILRY